MITKGVKIGLVFILFFSEKYYSQDIQYARKVIDTLTAEYFSGRSVADSGEYKAALYIQNEYKYFGLTPIDTSFFQSFSYSINTFPGDAMVHVDSKELLPGIDFLVHPSSPKIYGEFNLIWYNETNVPSIKQLKQLAAEHFFDSRFIVIDLQKETSKSKELELLKINAVGALGIIFLEDTKLTHRISTKVTDYVTLQVLRTSIKPTSKTIIVKIDQQFILNYTSQNVIGKITGIESPDSVVVFSAHYDHLGKMGNKTYFPGANDNASGVAMLLNLAKFYSQNPPKKSMVFMAFGAEESGIIGSKHYTENPLFPLSQINFLVNLDLMGTGDDGIQVVNGSVFPYFFEKLTSINQQQQLLKEIKVRGKAANSDHYWFSEKNVPSFFIYTLGGISAYHDVYDVSKTLPLTKFEACFKILTEFVKEI